MLWRRLIGIRQRLIFPGCSATSSVNRNLVRLTNILRCCRRSSYKMRPVLSTRARPRSWSPSPDTLRGWGRQPNLICARHKLVCDQNCFFAPLELNYGACVEEPTFVSLVGVVPEGRAQGTGCPIWQRSSAQFEPVAWWWTRKQIGRDLRELYEVPKDLPPEVRRVLKIDGHAAVSSDGGVETKGAAN